MSNTVPASVIKKTQDTLGKHVKKPPLTEKLLKKPPFRFLHDVISAVIRDKGILEGLFTEEEMDSAKVKDKEGKLKYLEKIIHAVSFATGTNLAAKPGKIISGQDAVKTNEFLVALASIADKKLDTSDAVRRTLNGEKPGKAPPEKKRSNNKENQNSNNNNNKTSPTKKSSSSKKTPSSSSSTKSSSKTASIKETPKKDLLEEPEAPQSPAPPPPMTNGLDNHHSHPGSASGGSGSGGSGGGSGGGETEELLANNDDGSLPSVLGHDSGIGTGADTASSLSGGGGDHSEPAQTTSNNNPPSSSTPRSATTTNETTAIGATSATASNAPRPGSAMKSARPRTGRLKSARPPSARPAAPRLREKTEIMAEEEIQARPMTGKVVNVIVDDGNDDDDDAEEFLVEEAHNKKDLLDLSLEGTTATPSAETDAAVSTGGQEHGALVQQILETQKEFNQIEEKHKPTVEIERESGLTDLTRRREREATQREIDKLRESIQTLTRYANPLGKLMDFLQEDVDAMQRELDTWRDEKRKYQLQLNHEEALTQHSIEPLKEQLIELESSVNDQLDKISTVKANILKNEEKINRMIGSIGVINK